MLDGHLADPTHSQIEHISKPLDEYLTHVVGFKLVTPHHRQNGNNPFPSRTVSPAPESSHVVGKKERPLSHRQRHIEASRMDRFERAAVFSYAVDCPLNMSLTITWTALINAGEQSEGNCLARANRDAYLRSELARLCRKIGIPFSALWGRDVGREMGEHIHLLMFCPYYRLAELVALLERVTGSSAECVRAPYADDEVARSVCGGWQVNMNRRDIEGARGFAEYIAGQHSKHPEGADLEGKAFGVSQAINTKAQERHQPVLDERRRKYAWLRIGKGRAGQISEAAPNCYLAPTSIFADSCEQSG